MTTVVRGAKKPCRVPEHPAGRVSTHPEHPSGKAECPVFLLACHLLALSIARSPNRSPAADAPSPVRLSQEEDEEAAEEEDELVEGLAQFASSRSAEQVKAPPTLQTLQAPIVLRALPSAFEVAALQDPSHDWAWCSMGVRHSGEDWGWPCAP